MTDGELDLALAEELKAMATVSEENLQETPETPEAVSSTTMTTIEPPESVSAIETEQELVLQAEEQEPTEHEGDDIVIVDKPAAKVGFVKRWTRKIVGWVKRVFNWRKG